MVEFTDYQCPFCRRFHDATFPEIKKNYIDTGKLRFASRDLPLGFHQNAFRAAEAARCAGDQNQFWQMRELLSANPSKLSADDITGYAKSLSLKLPEFDACLSSEKYKPSIEKDKALATSLHITGTPSFIIGKSTPAGVDGIVVMGAYPFASFDAKFKEFESAK
ncbi:MAG: DsbA family protein [Acidobacteria bacterium]|nr:DsbA family protein [Acidobacteriota bacterium]